MAEAWIIDGVRSPRGKGKDTGSLHHIHPQELLAQVLKGLQVQPLQQQLMDARLGVLVGLSRPGDRCGPGGQRPAGVLHGCGGGLGSCPGAQSFAKTHALCLMALVLRGGTALRASGCSPWVRRAAGCAAPARAGRG